MIEVIEWIRFVENDSKVDYKIPRAAALGVSQSKAQGKAVNTGSLPRLVPVDGRRPACGCRDGEKNKVAPIPWKAHSAPANGIGKTSQRLSTDGQNASSTS